MGTSMPKPALRPFLPEDIGTLVNIYQASVMELTGEDYSEAQQEVWAALAEEEPFAKRVAAGLTLLATLEGSPVGFATLQDNAHVDFFYIHPAVAGQGVGSMLYDAIEKIARARGAIKLTVDASDTARPFFEKRGYAAQRRNTIPLGDEWLANTSMEKRFEETSDRKLSS